MAQKKTTKKRVVAKPEEVKRVKNAQSWSIDLIVGVIIFVLIIAVFYALLTTKSEPSIQDLEENTRAVVTKLSAKDAKVYSIIQDGVISETDYNDLCAKDYDQLKRDLGIENDFCIYLEDQEGNLIPCGNPPQAGIGNKVDIIVGQNIACGAPIPP